MSGSLYPSPTFYSALLSGGSGVFLPGVQNVAALQSATSTTLPNGNCYLHGYRSGLDGGEGFFKTGSTATANGGTIFTDASGRTWYRQTNNQLCIPEWFGAYGDHVTDDTAAVQAALNWLGNMGGGTLTIPSGDFFLINSANLNIPKNVMIVGDAAPLLTGGQSTWTSGCGFIVNPAYTITFTDSSQIYNLVIKSPNLLANPTSAQIIAAVAAWHSAGGTALTAINAVGGVTMSNVFIIGFNQAINIQQGEFFFQNVWIDCYNGVYMSGAGDNSVMDNVRCEPFYSGFDQASQARGGIAFNLSGSTGITMRKCFVGCWVVGYFYTNLGICTFIDSGYEWFSGVTKPSGTAAFQGQNGSSAETKFIGCYAINASTSWLLSEPSGHISLIGCSAGAPASGDSTYVCLISIYDQTIGLIEGCSFNLAGRADHVPIAIAAHTAGTLGWKFIGNTVYNTAAAPPSTIFSYGNQAAQQSIDILGIRMFGSGITNTQQYSIHNSALHEKLELMADVSMSATDGSSQAVLSLFDTASFPTGSANYMIGFWTGFYGNLVSGITLNTAGNTIAYNTGSDERLKDNLIPLTGQGEIIDALEPMSWTWKDAGNKAVGFPAQRLSRVLPNAVIPGDETAIDKSDPNFKTWQVSTTDPIVPYLVAEVQELRKRLAKLEEE